MEPTGASVNLTAAQFDREVTQNGGDVAWRQAQVKRVLASLDEAEREMSKAGVEEVKKYLKTGKWISHCHLASSHTAYRRFMGKSDFESTLYYPHFFVIQAIYVLGGGPIHDAIRGMYREMSGHWGMFITPDKPFYPRLGDSEKERRLIFGNIQGPATPSGRQATSEDRHKELSLHLEAAAKLSSEIQDNGEVNQRRSIDLQRMRDELRHAQQRNLYLERKVEEETQKRHNAERHKQALQDQLNQKSDQLRHAVTHLGESRRYAKGLEDQLGRCKPTSNVINKSQWRLKSSTGSAMQKAL
ncbi:hypothetical protein FNYG_14231 [Fusarium nygamai]|uniref:Uncharacterized protein n=1 Tax=Gibberella nygamai TaxID=42673 RepID=A0A2K0UTP2_GIBNY|nr:hypothetical protein FNYG_14231 [Fusarium nygamai]